MIMYESYRDYLTLIHVVPYNRRVSDNVARVFVYFKSMEAAAKWVHVPEMQRNHRYTAHQPFAWIYRQ